MKLKLGASNQDLYLRFNIKEDYVSTNISTSLPKLAKLIIWLEREAVREDLPK